MADRLEAGEVAPTFVCINGALTAKGKNSPGRAELHEIRIADRLNFKKLGVKLS